MLIFKQQHPTGKWASYMANVIPPTLKILNGKHFVEGSKLKNVNAIY